MLKIVLFVHCALALSVFGVMLWRRVSRVFPQLAINVSVEAISSGIAIALLYFRAKLHISHDAAYPAFFAATWAFTGIFLLLRILIVYSVFGEAMRPLTGLHQAGKLIFKWVAVVSVLVAFALLASPGIFSGREALVNILTHLQQGVSVLTLCLLVFVCFAVRPLGLTFRSHIFGVSLGLGITSTVDLIQAAWLVTSTGHSVYSPIALFGSAGNCVALLAWGVYFVLPDPPRRMILLPTTSPFFFWNRISEILGDSPGHVAVAGFTPTMLAPAEIEMLTTATAGDADRLGVDQGLQLPLTLPRSPGLLPGGLRDLGNAVAKADPSDPPRPPRPEDLYAGELGTGIHPSAVL